MPPMPPMFPMMPPPQPPLPPRHSFVRGILVTLATTIFGFSLMLNLYLIMAGSILSGGSSSRQTVLRDGDVTQKVAVVPLSGVIMDSAYEKFNRLMDRLDKDPDVKAVVLEIDSPGGSVTASDQIYHRIEKYKAEHQGVPIVTSMAGLAASGGYYAACPTDYIIAQPTTITGSIGVLLPSYNYSELMKRFGVNDNTVISSGAPFKDAGSGSKPETPEHRKYLQDITDQMFTQFKSVVSKGRNGKLKFPIEEIANGKIYTAPDALKNGLIDQLGYMDDAINYAASAAKLSKPKAVRYQENQGLRDLLLGGESEGKAPTRGITVSISPEMIDQLTTPRMMYLWKGE
jgi:protease-4